MNFGLRIAAVGTRAVAFAAVAIASGTPVAIGAAEIRTVTTTWAAEVRTVTTWAAEVWTVTTGAAEVWTVTTGAAGSTATRLRTQFLAVEFAVLVFVQCGERLSGVFHLLSGDDAITILVNRGQDRAHSRAESTRTTATSTLATAITFAGASGTTFLRATTSEL